ncbi:amine oxidase, partial [Candidatus Thiomargarita nelsonii]
MKIAVIGAGPAGICAAYELSKAGVEVEVFDSANVVGGMCRSITLWEKTVDIGSHIFYPETPQVKALWLEAVGNDYRYIDVKRAILTDDGVYSYPLKFSKVILNRSVGETMLGAFSYLHGQLWRPRNEDSAEAWVIRRFG